MVRQGCLGGADPAAAVRARQKGTAMALRIRLPGGTLKFKSFRELRSRERDRVVPVFRLGSLYIIWWPNSLGSQDGRH